MESKAQITIETISILSMMTIMFAVVSVPLHDMSRSSALDIGDIALARQAVHHLADSVNMVGASGSGSVKESTLWLPPNSTVYCINSVDAGLIVVETRLFNGTLTNQSHILKYSETIIPDLPLKEATNYNLTNCGTTSPIVDDGGGCYILKLKNEDNVIDITKEKC